MGRYCGAWLIPHHEIAARLIEPRIHSAAADAGGFGFDLTAEEANALTTNVRLLVRTSRGTQLVDFGQPVPAVIDAEGHVTNVIGHLWNCMTYSTEDKRSLIFGNDPLRLAREDVLPPLEDLRWARLLQATWGIDVQLILLTDLEPGETVVFESPTRRVQVAADRDGRALLPGFAPAGLNAAPAQLPRLNQGPLTEREVSRV